MIVGWEWMWQRTRRLALLLLHPHILAGALQIAESLDRYCEINDIPQESITLGEAKFIRGLQYIEYPLLEG